MPEPPPAAVGREVPLIGPGSRFQPVGISYYQSSLPQLQIDTAAPASLSGQRFDLAIVGGGYTGLSAALTAAGLGLSVCLLEAQRFGAGASGRNGGQVIPGFRHGLPALISQLGRDRAVALHQLTLRGRDWIWQIAGQSGIDCHLAGGHLHVAARRADMAEFRHEADSIRHLMPQHDVRVVEAAELPGLLGVEGYHGGLLDAAGGHLHPLRLALALAQAAAQAGAQLAESVTVHALHPDRTGVTLHLESGLSLRADQVLLACDALIDRIAPALAPALGHRLMPVGNYQIATAPLPVDQAQALIPSGVAVSDSKFALDYYRLSRDCRLIFSGGERYSWHPPRDIASFARPHLARVFPALAAVPIDFAWGGIVGVTTRRYPHIIRQGRVFAAHGYSGHGVILANVAGRAVAEAVAGQTQDFDLLADLPGAAWPGGSALRRPLFVAGALWYALRDRL